MPLNGNKTLQSLRLETLANEVVVGLMSVTLGMNK
jgi:ribosomal protein L30/L7E